MIWRSSNWSVRPWSEAFFRAGLTTTTTTTGPPHSLFPSKACSSSFLHFIPFLIACFHHCIVSFKNQKIFRAVSLPPCYFPGKNPLPSIEEIMIFQEIYCDEYDAAVVSSLVNPSYIANMNDSWGFPRIIARQLKITPDAIRAWINADLSTGFLTALLQVSIMMVGLHSYCTRMLTRWQVYRVIIVVISRALFRNRT